MPGSSQNMTVPQFSRRKGNGPPLVVLTAYDAPTMMAAEAGGVDAVLIGDSLANVVLGYESTLPVTLDEMIHHSAAVSRARKRTLLIGDMPWMTYHVNPEEALRNAARFIREGGVDAVKLEGGAKRVAAIRKIVDAEIPVMGHLGLTPQSLLSMGGYKVQGRNEEAVRTIVEDARGPGGRGGVLHRARGDAPRRRRAGHGRGGRSHDRHRGRRGLRRAGAGVPRSARHAARDAAEIRPALRRDLRPAV